MARIEVGGDSVAVRLSTLEKIGALRGDVVVPRDAVKDARVSASRFGEVSGIRAPGTGFPGLIRLGTYRRGRGRKDFAAVHGSAPVLVIELDAERAVFERLIVSTAEAEQVHGLLTR